MRTFLLASFIFMIDQSWSQSNDFYFPKNNVGIVGGLNRSTKCSNNYDPNSKLGYRIGVLGSHFVSTKLFLSSEPSFVYDDTKISTTNNTTISTAPNSFFEMEEKNYWIEAPIHLNFIPLRSLAPRVLLKSDATLGYTFTNANGQHEAIRGTNSLMDRRNKWNLFLTTRIGYMTVRGRNKFLVSLSFERSLLKIVHPYHHPNASLVYDDPSYTLNTNSLLAAYTF